MADFIELPSGAVIKSDLIQGVSEVKSVYDKYYFRVFLADGFRLSFKFSTFAECEKTQMQIAGQLVDTKAE